MVLQRVKTRSKTNLKQEIPGVQTVYFLLLYRIQQEHLRYFQREEHTPYRDFLCEILKVLVFYPLGMKCVKNQDKAVYFRRHLFPNNRNFFQVLSPYFL